MERRWTILVLARLAVALVIAVERPQRAAVDGVVATALLSAKNMKQTVQMSQWLDAGQ